MILINKTQTKIHSHHRRDVFLQPGPNEIDEASLTKSERAMIDGFVKAGIVERGEAKAETPPVAPVTVASEPLDRLEVVLDRTTPSEGVELKMSLDSGATFGPVQTVEESAQPKRKRAKT